ncbi:unnamed protein product, partial [Mesorhabditis spiculigera]
MFTSFRKVALLGRLAWDGVLTWLPLSLSSEKEFILEKAKGAKNEDTWLGAKRGANNDFEWLDGSKWENGYWSSLGVPLRNETTKNCLVLCNLADHVKSLSMHRYYDDDCNKEMMGMCKKAGNKGPSPTKA